MDYEYNGHLTYEQRIEQVANEIIKKYPEIDHKDATKIASLEGKIDTVKNYKMEFTRLYNILLITKDKKGIYLEVLEDLKNIYYENIQKNKHQYSLEDRIMEEIISYDLGKRKIFPIISEFY